MKTLLIPTNFSDIARHATDYAIQLCGNDVTRIILLNSYEQPRTGRTVQISLIDILKKTSERGLQEDELRIKEAFPQQQIAIERISIQGELCSSIRSVLDKENVDLIAMGSKGDQQFLDLFVESVTARVISEIDHPMLVVPPNAKFQSLDKIVLATDLKKLTDRSIIEPMIDLSQTHNAAIDILHIVRNGNGPNKSMEEMMDNMLTDVSHHFEYRKNSNIHTGIYKYLHESNSDILTLVKRKGRGSLVARLFQKSVSRRIAKNVRQTLLLLTDEDSDLLT